MVKSDEVSTIGLSSPDEIIGHISFDICHWAIAELVELENSHSKSPSHPRGAQMTI